MYYDLAAARRQGEVDDVAIVRLEQLYPFPCEQLQHELEQYPAGTRLCWVQEEPWNMGAWPYIKLRHADALQETRPLELVSRGEAASPATGSSSRHKLEQKDLVERALNLDGHQTAANNQRRHTE